MGVAAFWQLGHRLLKTTPVSLFAVSFIAGDAFDPDFLKPYPPISAHFDTPPPSEVKTLIELRGRSTHPRSSTSSTKNISSRWRTRSWASSRIWAR